jgi:quaternary ammonium compound-resistance protein SugE
MWKAWVFLFFAGLLEIVWAVSLKRTEGFTRLLPSLFTISVMAVSLYFLGKAVRDLPMGTAYAIWTGIGAAGVALVGIFLAGESAAPARLLCLMLIVAGTVGLKLTQG